MKYTILLVFMMTCSSAFAQTDDPQLLKLYRKGKDEKVLMQVEKKLKKDPGNAVLYFYKSKSAFRIYTQNRRRSEKQLNDILGALTNAQQLSGTNIFISADTSFISALRKVIFRKVNQYKDKQVLKATVYTDFLARQLHDTIDFYWKLYPKQVIEVVTYDTLELKPEKKIKTVDFLEKPDLPANRDSVVAFASRFLGTPYKWAGETPAGFDCSGFVLYVMRRYGYDFYHRTTQIANLGLKVSIDEAKAGDIIVFGSRIDDKYHVSHVGILAENIGESRKVIHAVNRGVCLDDITDGHWKDYVLFVRRIID